MDYEDVADMSNFTFDHDVSVASSAAYIAHEIIFTLLALVGICADAFIIYTIFHFKMMRKPENIFVANWAIADLCALVVLPSTYRIVSVIDSFSLSSEFMCILFELSATIHFTEQLIVFIVTIDWMLSAFFPRASAPLRRYYQYILGGVWVFALVSCGGTSIACLAHHHSDFFTFSLLTIFGIHLLTVIGIQSTRGIRRWLNKYSDYSTVHLTLTTAFTLCWTFAYFVTLVQLFHYGFFEVIFECILLSNSMVNLTLLYFLNKDFQACLLQVFRRSGNQYENTIADMEQPETTAPKTNGTVQIAFNEPDDEFLNNSF